MKMAAELSPDDVVVQISAANTTILSSEAAISGTGRGPNSSFVDLGRRLLLAARFGDTPLVLDLMAKGAPFTTDWLGTSPLHLAAGNAHVDACVVLLRAGVSRDSRTKVDRTPLHLAAHAGHAAVAKLLLEHGALVDSKDMLRMTPLHWAADKGHSSVAALLLAYGADPHAVSKFNKTPLSLATARGFTDIVKMIEDTLKEREAAKSVDALRVANEEAMEVTASEQQQALESIERLQETVKQTNKQIPSVMQAEPIKITIDRPPETGSGGGGGEAGAALAAQLLQRHGITLLPHDDGSTVLNAIQSGRTVVLSDAGKLMLKESNSTPRSTAAAAPPPPPPPAPAPTKGVVLTATPVKSPPKAGVKIFTLNNKLLAMPKENKAPVKKIVNPFDMQIKFVAMPMESKLVPPAGAGRARARRPQLAPAPLGAGAGAAQQQKPVKIIMHKANFNKIIGNSGKMIENGTEASITPLMAPAAAAPAAADGVVCVPEEFITNNSPAYLRAQLINAHKAIAGLNAELAAVKARLAHYEVPQ